MFKFLGICIVCFLQSPLFLQNSLSGQTKTIEKATAIYKDGNYYKRTLHNREFLNPMPDGGGELTGYYKNGTLYWMQCRIGYSFGVKTTEFYYESGQLFYVNKNVKVFRYDDVSASIDHSQQEFGMNGHYFFQNNKLYSKEDSTSNKYKGLFPNIIENLPSESKNYIIALENINQIRPNSVLSVNLNANNRDTLVQYGFLDQDLILTRISFNYPLLTEKKFENGYLTVYNDSITVQLKETPFIPERHELAFNDSLPAVYGLEKIDGTEFYGSDGGIPSTQLDEIIITVNDGVFLIDKYNYKDLFNPMLNPNKLKVYTADHGRIILAFMGSDGAGGYYACFIIRDGKIEKKITGIGF